jgi:hypothetical protein
MLEASFFGIDATQAKALTMQMLAEARKLTSGSMANWFSKNNNASRRYLALNMQQAPLPANQPFSDYATFICKLRSRAWFNHQVTSQESTILVLIGNADDGEA